MRRLAFRDRSGLLLLALGVLAGCQTPLSSARAPAPTTDFVRVAEDGAEQHVGPASPVSSLPEEQIRGRYYEHRGPIPLRAARSENARVGPYGQPEWTTQRRFATTREYVLAPWQVELETWWKGKFPDEGKATHLFQQEIGIGLPHRFQLDLYGNVEKNPDQDARYQGTQVELRYALAAWGRIPFNPTLYGEWKFNVHDAPDAWEVKLLLARDFGCRWHSGVNLFFERETGGEYAEEMGASAALGYTLVDQRLSIGVEAQYERASVRGARSDPEVELLLGPSLQWRPTPATHLDLVPLFGLTDDAPAVEAYVVFGIDIGRGGGGGFAPTSTQSR